MSKRKARRLALFTCAHCGAGFHPWRNDQECCSRSCSRKHSPKFLAHLRKAARAGGLAGGRARRLKAIEKWNREIGSMSKVEIAKAFYRKGYNNGSAKVRRASYAQGWEDCVQAMERRVA